MTIIGVNLMINKGFFSETFLEEYKNIKLTELQKEYIENFSYGLSILKEDLSEENKSRANKKYLAEIFETVLQTLDFNDFNIDNDLFVLYGSKNTEKDAAIVIDFVTSLESYSDNFGEYKEINAINYAKEKNIKLAVITDGFKWRVYRLDIANYFETYIELDIKDYSIHQNLDDVNMKLFIDLFYGQNYIITEDEKSYCIDTLFEKNDKVIENIEKELKSKMEDILSGIGLGFKEHIGTEKFEDQERKELYRDSITVLYRTLFILYAETKGIFNTEDKTYKENSLSHIINDIPRLVGELDKIGNEYTLWDRLSTLFTWINEGKQSLDFSFTAYNGGLFSNQNRNILSNNKINNRNLVKTLGMLGYYGKDEFSIKINFNDITTRSFGTLYEGILDYNMFIAEEDLLKRTEKNKILYIPLKDANAKKTELINVIKKGEIYLSGDALERKETGAYYTPEPIVEYIVSNTVDIKVKDKLEELQTLVNPILEELKITVNPLLENALKIKVVETIEEYIKKNILTLSVLDNAMGSGHFLVNAAYHISNLIFSFIHKNISFSVEDFENLNFTSYQYWKRQVVSHNIYGVDINELAVQLGKLSLWLISASKDKPLSFIDHHIKCGNSLIGTSSKDIDEVLGERVGLFDTSLDDLMQKLENMYIELEKMPENNADEVHDKEKCYEEILNELEIVKKKWDIFLAMKLIDKKGKVDNIAYTNIASSSYDLEKIENEYRVHYEQWEELSRENQFFHWELEFPEVFKGKEKGFDCIIGNPPYVRVQNMNHTFIDACFKLFYSPKGKLDISILFFEKVFLLLNDNGINSYISSTQWISTDYGKNIREILAKGYINQIIDFGSLEVFKKISTYPGIFLISKKIQEKLLYTKISEMKEFYEFQFKRQEINYEILSNEIWNFGEFNLINCLKENKINYKLLSEIAPSFTGDICGLDKAFVVSKEDIEKFSLEKELVYKYYYRGEEIVGYKEIDTFNYIIYPYRVINEKELEYIKEEEMIEKFPNILNYLLTHKEELMERKDSRKLYALVDWYKHVRQGSAHCLINSKLIVKGVEKELKVSLIKKNTLFNGANVPCLIIKDSDYTENYLLGILNSKLITFYMNQISPKKLNDYYRYSVSNLKNIPIVLEEKLKIEDLVEKIKCSIDENYILKCKRELNNLIYHIYNLTEEEMKIIEESIK